MKITSIAGADTGKISAQVAATANAAEPGVAATTGKWANAATTDYRANAATTGKWANAATTDYRANAATTGEGAVAAALGGNGRAKAGVGGAIVLCHREGNGAIVHIRASKVGENGIQPNVWYSLDKGGEIIEVSL